LLAAGLFPRGLLLGIRGALSLGQRLFQMSLLVLLFFGRFAADLQRSAVHHCASTYRCAVALRIDEVRHARGRMRHRCTNAAIAQELTRRSQSAHARRIGCSVGRGSGTGTVRR
jgi:hypothetical protein